MKRITFLIIYFLISRLFLSQGITYNTEFQVNTFVKNDQWNPNVKGISNGGFVVSWECFGQFDRLWNISAQIFNQDGEKVGDEIIIKSPNNDFNIGGNSLSAFGDEGFIISYDKEGKGIFAQKYNFAGDKIGSETEITNDPLSYHSSIAEFANDGFAVCWRKLNQQFEVEGVFCKIFNNNGEILVDEFKVNTINLSTDQFPWVSSLDNGGIIITWQSQITGWSKYPVYFKIYDNKGFAVSDEVKVSSMYGNLFSTNQTSKLGNNKFIIVWDGINTDDGSDYIFAKIFNNDGSNVGREISITKKRHNETNPVVKGLSNGEFIVSWES